LLLADFEVAHAAAWLKPLCDDDAPALGKRFAELEHEVLEEMGRSESIVIGWRAALRYAGQGFELPVDVPRGALNAAVLAQVRAAFEEAHRRSYGHALPGERIDFVSLRVVGTLPPNGGGLAGVRAGVGAASPAVMRVRRHSQGPLAGTRMAYFGRERGLMPTPVMERWELTAEPRQGPLIVEEYEGTTVVPPQATAYLDAHGNIVINL
jgi:N-methylhydantoinase A